MLSGTRPWQGGMVAVVWTDMIQSVAMMTCSALLLIYAVVKVDGGFSGVMTELRDHNRALDAHFLVPDPTSGTRTSPPKVDL